MWHMYEVCQFITIHTHKKFSAGEGSHGLPRGEFPSGPTARATNARCAYGSHFPPVRPMITIENSYDGH